MQQIKNKNFTTLYPDENKHLKNINSGEMYEDSICLGIYDSAENYVEVSEEEYQEWLNRIIDEVNYE